MIRPSNRGSLGRGLLSGGYVLLGVCGGTALGYWASDWGNRFVPTVLSWILLLLACGFCLFAIGSYRERPVERERRWGRRASTFAALSVASLAALGATLILGRPTPLTALTEAEFLRAHELDARYFRDLDRGLRGVVARLSIRDDLFDATREPPLTAEDEALLVDAWASYLDTAIALDRVRLFHEDYYRFDLSRLERVRHVRSFLLSFAAELSLYENTTRLIELFDTNGNVVRFLNLERPKRGIARDSLARMREELSGLTDLSRVSAGSRYLAYLDRAHHARAEASAESFEWLWGEVERYLDAVELRRRRDVVTLATASDFAPVLRGVKHLTFPVQKEVAQFMGNVRFARPGEYLITPAQAGEIERRLKPGDILLGRKNWYLSNVGLPGFWPHAMLYVGDGDAIAAAFDDDPAVLAWVANAAGRATTLTEYLRERYPLAWQRREMSSANEHPLTVIEAVSEGVIQNSVYGSAGDYMAAIRPRVAGVVKARAIVRAFSFLDRQYDFDFDFATDQTLVCTEVVWRAYRSSPELAGLRLDPITVAGRLTLPPNEIVREFAAEYGDDDARFDFVYYLEADPDGARAVASTVDAFLATPDKSKWTH